MTGLLFWLCVVTAFAAILRYIWLVFVKSKVKLKTICVLVLGDVGRSPRMQYHSLSYAKEGFQVDLVGYAGSAPLAELRDHPSVKMHLLRPESNFENLPRLLGYVVKTLRQSALLLRMLPNISTTYLMIQNPPAIPTIPICWLYCRLTNTKLIIDWHNYAYTIMGLTLGREHILVRATLAIESLFGARADQHFCVTKAMSEDLNAKWNIKAEVLYDRPPEEFRPIELSEKHTLLTELGKLYEPFREEDSSSRFTEESLTSGDVVEKPSRPGLVVSSTSWTEDEDFSILFNALHEYERAAGVENSHLPDLVCAITGKGPLKEFWNAIIEKKKWQRVKVVTPWLKNEDYPKLLASADLGVCLHTSSSGLDLPMKVVDMFGCGLPVCAYNYKCLDELVRHNENSLVFSSDKELAEQIKTWFSDFPNNEEQQSVRTKFQRELTKFRELRWHGNWSSVVLPSHAR